MVPGFEAPKLIVFSPVSFSLFFCLISLSILFLIISLFFIIQEIVQPCFTHHVFTHHIISQLMQNVAFTYFRVLGVHLCLSFF